mmetsp:Transcript_7902/g.10048  ORF Transcript_7902/g.10048 Transcript_7902/m.10048 type:complete len:109 (+) Transcript_7902:1599-1925(+)
MLTGDNPMILTVILFMKCRHRFPTFPRPHSLMHNMPIPKISGADFPRVLLNKCYLNYELPIEFIRDTLNFHLPIFNQKKHLLLVVQNTCSRHRNLLSLFARGPEELSH